MYFNFPYVTALGIFNLTANYSSGGSVVHQSPAAAVVVWTEKLPCSASMGGECREATHSQSHFLC